MAKSRVGKTKSKAVKTVKAIKSLKSKIKKKVNIGIKFNTTKMTIVQRAAIYRAEQELGLAGVYFNGRTEKDTHGQVSNIVWGFGRGLNGPVELEMK